eukprot:10085095-Heterocapsa_arctica.AAC.1
MLKEKFEGEDKEMINLVSIRRSTSTATSSSRSSSSSLVCGSGGSLCDRREEVPTGFTVASLA